MHEVLLADLQQKQGLDFEGILQDIQKMVYLFTCTNMTAAYTFIKTKHLFEIMLF